MVSEKSLANLKGGSRKGRKNKVNKEIKDLIRGALDDAGGRQYLFEQAKLNPVAFMALIGKIIPKEVSSTVEQTTTLKEPIVIVRATKQDADSPN